MREKQTSLSFKDLRHKAVRTVAALGFVAGLHLALTASAYADGGGNGSLLGVSGGSEDANSLLLSPNPRRTYTQCGQTLGLNGYPANDVIYVIDITMPDLTQRYVTQDFGPLPDQCGNGPYPEPDYMVAPLGPNPMQGHPDSLTNMYGKTYYFARRYFQCGGILGVMSLRSRDTILVDQFTSADGDSTYGIRDLGPIAGQCGNQPSDSSNNP